jgi:microcystin-dependent protein
LQTLSVIGNRLTLSKSNQVNIDADTTNELQTLTKNNNILSISKTNQVIIDGDTTNEIQSLNYANDSLSITKSNKVFMPSVPSGTIVSFGGRNIPQGWLLCDGREISRSSYAILYLSIDSVWGNGNGTTTFNLPDLRGQFLRGVSGTSNVDPDTTIRTQKFSGGNSGNRVGSYQGDEIKSHNHSIQQVGQSSSCGNLSGTTGSWSCNPYPTANTGGNESRPKNAYVYYIIKY